MIRSCRFIVGSRFGEIPTLVRVQRCGLGRPPSTCARPTARPRWLCWWWCARPRRAERSSQTCLGACCCWTRLRRGRWASPCPLAWSSSVPKRKQHPERGTVGSEQSGKRKPNKHVVSGHSAVLSDDVGLAASAITRRCWCATWPNAPSLVIARQWFGFERHTSAQRQGRARRLRAMQRSLDQS